VKLPIRARLTAWYVALLVLIVVALGAFVVLRLRADLRADADRQLDTATEHIARAYRAEGFKDFHDVARTVLPRGDASARLVDRAGNVVASDGTGPPARARSGRSIVTAGGTRYRVHAEPLGNGLTLVTTQSLAEADRSVDRVLVLLLAGGGVAILITAVGGWWLARRALRPVDRMTAQADRIGAESLDRRLEVPRTRDEVAHLARTLNAMLDRVDRGLEDKRRLIADASHELRGPLAVMAAELDVSLAEPGLPSDARAVLESSREEVAHMARLVDDMLTLAAIDEGRLELVRGPVDLHELAEAIAGRARSRAEVFVEGERARVNGDAMRIEHALANLVDNAIKFGGDNAVHVTTWARNGEAGVTVSDRGPGVPVADRERVFERFVRLDAARGREQPGSGLGLAICREVAQAHGGRAWVEPRDDGGSRFCIALHA
jgi:signal transduction histidine kinase